MTRTPATGCGGPLFVLVRCRSCLQSRQRGVASTYVVFDMPTICYRQVASGACVCWSSRASPLLIEPHRPRSPRSAPQPRPGPGAFVAAHLADDVAPARAHPAKTGQLEDLAAPLV